MGIDTALLHELLQQVSPKSHIPLDRFKPSKKHVKIVDLTQLVRQLGRGQDEVSGKQLCSNFILLLKSLIKIEEGNKSIEILIICLDKNEYIPKEKEAEQKKRRQQTEKRGILPYSSKSKFTLNGIVKPSSENEPEEAELINIERLAISRSLRLEIGRFLQEEVLMKHSFSSTSIIFDYDPIQGPLWIPSDELRNTVEDTIRIKGEFKNKDGEADILMIRYAFYYLPTNPVIIHQIDTDLIPLSMNALMNRYIRQTEIWKIYPLHWYKPNYHPKSKKGDLVIDLTKCVADLLLDTNHFWPKQLFGYYHIINPNRVRWFVSLCILCGCDYYEKRIISHGFGWTKISQALIDSWNSIQSYILNIDKEPIDKQDKQFLAPFIYHLHKNKIEMKSQEEEESSSSNDIINEMARLNMNQYIVAIQDAMKSESIEQAVEQFRFTSRYWNINLFYPPSLSPFIP